MTSKFFSAAALVGLTLMGLGTGCTTTHHSKPGWAVNAQPEARVQADLEIGGQVEGTAQATKVLGLWLGPDTYADGVSYGVSPAPGGGIFATLLGPDTSGDAVKSAAAYNALQAGEYDIILGARYTLVINDFMIFKSYDATVRGWGAKVKGVKQIEPIR